MAKRHPQREVFAHQAVVAGELEIDAWGRIWRVAKRTWDRWREKTRTTPCTRVRAEIQAEPGGYMQVRVMIDRKRVYASAHRLVWHHTNGQIPDGVTINHKNGRKDDNRPSNLELATYSDQRHHAIRELGARHWEPKGEKHPKAQATEEIVRDMRRRRARGERVKDLAAEYGMRPKAVSAICNRRTWKHVP